MSDKIYQVIDSMILGSITPLKLKLIERLLNRGIPFNLPHRFKFLLITKYHVIVELPFIYKNKNHIGGVHACAIATLGEYPAGLLLIKNFGVKKYRFILQNLNVDYKKQGDANLLGETIIVRDDMINFKELMENEGLGVINLETSIKNKETKELVATVKTTWQLKSWKEVTYKVNQSDKES